MATTVWARMMRAYATQLVIQIATNMLKMLGPSIAMIAMTRTRNGKAKNRSTIRISTLSQRPPRNPATSPMIVPLTRVTAVAPNAIARSIRPPYRIRDSTSRPNWSVPSRWPGVSGGASGLSASMVLGGWLTSSGASVIAAIARTSMASPAISVSRRRTTLRRRADARVAAFISSSDGLAAHGVLMSRSPGRPSGPARTARYR